MREGPYRQSLAGRLINDSIESYCAYLRRVERIIGKDLDSCDLTNPGIEGITRQLEAEGMTAASVRNCRSALRAYARIDAA